MPPSSWKPKCRSGRGRVAAIVCTYRKGIFSQILGFFSNPGKGRDGSVAALLENPNEGLMTLPGFSSITGNKGSATLISKSSFCIRKAVFLKRIQSRKWKGGWRHGEQSFCDSTRSIFTFPVSMRLSVIACFPGTESSTVCLSDFTLKKLFIVKFVFLRPAVSLTENTCGSACGQINECFHQCLIKWQRRPSTKWVTQRERPLFLRIFSIVHLFSFLSSTEFGV